jgi:hypothetical protein
LLSCTSGVVVAVNTQNPSGDAGASGVWSTASNGFVLTEGGGVAATPAGVVPECTAASPTWSFDSTAQSVTRTGCRGGVSLAAKIALSPKGISQLVSLVSGVRRADASSVPSCGGDAANYTLSVLGAKGSKDYQSCPGAGSGPLVSFEDLFNLASQLDDDLAVCAPDGGLGSSAAATCTQVSTVGTRDASVADVSVVGDSGEGDATAHFTVAQGETVVTLASGQISPYVIALDSADVYWANWGDGNTSSGNGAVVKVPVGGGTPTTLASDLVMAGGIAVDSTNVYWTAGATGLARVPIGGGSSSSLSSSLINDSIVMGPSEVIGTTFGDGLASVTTVGGTATTLAGPIGLGGQNTYGLAVDSTSVYWSCFSDPCPVLKTPLGGGTSTTLATGHVVFGVAVDATNVYWAEAQAGTIMKVPVGGGQATTLASGLVGPNQLAIDATNLYVTAGGPGASGSSGAIVRVPKDGSPVAYLVMGLPSPNGIAVDATSVYWTTLGGAVSTSVDGAVTSVQGSIMKATPK